MVAVMSDRRADVLREAEQLSRLLEAQRFRGFDPYDALASPILRRLAVTPLARRAAIQLMKRSPLNIRRVVGVPAQQHTKALALCVSAYAAAGRPARRRPVPDTGPGAERVPRGERAGSRRRCRMGL